ncbi:MAG: retropepsin-like aspartic protease, partial [Cyclobacteriaceae bacterium]
MFSLQLTTHLMARIGLPWLSIYVFLILLIKAIPGYTQLPPGQLESKNKIMEISLIDPQKEILVKAKLKGEEFTFLLDTGAPFFISNAIQDRFNFPVLFKANLSDASGKKDETLIVSVDSLSLGPFIFTNVWAVVIKMDNETHQCHEFVGNFGSNLLNFLAVQFDLQKHKVFLTDNMNLLEHQPAAFQPASLSSQRDFYFPITIQGNIPDTIHFDSGDGSLYEISPRTLAKLTKVDSGSILKKGFGVTSMGSLGLPKHSNQYVIRSNISLANSTISNGIAHNTYAEKSRLGRYIFHYGRMTLDYINQRYAFEQYDKFTLSELSDFGFTVLVSNNRVLTGTVWE